MCAAVMLSWLLSFAGVQRANLASSGATRPQPAAPSAVSIATPVTRGADPPCLQSAV